MNLYLYHLNINCFLLVINRKKEERYKNNMRQRYCFIKQFPKSKCIKASYEPFGNNKYLNIDYIINNL